MASNLEQTHSEFLEYLRTQGKASATILAYGNDITQFFDFIQSQGKTELGAIDKEDIELFKEHLLEIKYTTKSVARKLNSIKTFFRFLKTSNLITADPSEGVAHPKYVLTPPRILTRMEYRSLRDVCRNDPRMYAIVELFLQTGIRISELARLTTNDVVNGKLVVGAFESHDRRIIPLNKSAKAALDMWLDARPRSSSKALFVTKTGKMFQVRNIRTALERYFKLADIQNATVNDLRHTFIAHQLRAGTPLTLVSRLAGHKRLSTTEKYLEFIKEKNNTESMKLEEL